MGGDPSKHHWEGVLFSALDAVGHTPLIRLERLARQEGLKCNLLAKCEFFSAGGSVKDRIAKRMVEHAEEDNVLIPGRSVVIEPTSGNTGIGLALACAIKGYQCIITLPAKMSLEKEVMLQALGAVIVRTPQVAPQIMPARELMTEAAWDSPESHIGVASILQQRIPNAIILDQYSNPHNPLAHYHSTYSEIMHSLETSDLPRKDIALLVAGAGTGGTITGIARAIRDAESRTRLSSAPRAESGGGGTRLNGHAAASHAGANGVRARVNAHAQTAAGRATVLAVDPEGSILGGGEPGVYEVEGIGYDFFPEVLDPEPPLIDQWIKTNDSEAFAITKRVIRTEGLFVGGSSGSALSGAIRYLHSPAGSGIANDPTANVIVILPDGVRNYMSKPWFLDQPDEPRTADLRKTIRETLGRDLGDPGAVVTQAEEEGRVLQNNDGIGGHTTAGGAADGNDIGDDERGESSAAKALANLRTWLEDSHSASDADIVAKIRAMAV